MTVNTVVGCVAVTTLTGCVDDDVGFADTVFTGLLSVTDTDGALRHVLHQQLLTTHSFT